MLILKKKNNQFQYIYKKILIFLFVNLFIYLTL